MGGSWKTCDHDPISPVVVVGVGTLGRLLRLVKKTSLLLGEGLFVDENFGAQFVKVVWDCWRGRSTIFLFFLFFLLSSG